MTAPLAALPPREVSPDLRARLRAAISDAYYDARNEGRTMESAADRAVEAVLPIVASVDANAHLRGAAEAHVAIARRAGS